MRKGSAFTLVELLIAMTILTLLVVLTASLLSSVSKAWVSGQQQVETFQDGRAILNLIARDLSQAVISQRLQFIQNPGSLNPQRGDAGRVPIALGKGGGAAGVARGWEEITDEGDLVQVFLVDARRRFAFARPSLAAGGRGWVVVVCRDDVRVVFRIVIARRGC